MEEEEREWGKVAGCMHECIAEMERERVRKRASREDCLGVFV